MVFNMSKYLFCFFSFFFPFLLLLVGGESCKPNLLEVHITLYRENITQKLKKN